MAAKKEWPDESKPFGAEEIKWLHEWGLDYKIEENLRRFAESEQHDEGIPPDTAKALREAGIQPPPPPANPQYVDGAPLHPVTQVPGNASQEAADNEGSEEAMPFDEEATRAELESWHVPELKAELVARKLSDDGVKAELIERLVDYLKAESPSDS